MRSEILTTDVGEWPWFRSALVKWEQKIERGEGLTLGNFADRSSDPERITFTGRRGELEVIVVLERRPKLAECGQATEMTEAESGIAGRCGLPPDHPDCPHFAVRLDFPNLRVTSVTIRRPLELAREEAPEESP